MVSTSIFPIKSSVNTDQSLRICTRPGSRACDLNFLLSVRDNGIGAWVKTSNFQSTICTRSPSRLVICDERRRYAIIFLFYFLSSVQYLSSDLVGSTQDHRRGADHLRAEIQLGVRVLTGESRGIGATHRQAVDRNHRGEASGQVAKAAMLPGMALLKESNHGIGVKHQQVEDRKVRNEASGQAVEESR
jgi:hypothetical protein